MTAKRITILMVITILSTIPHILKAGDLDNRLMVGTGLLYENGWEATIAYERETKYHNSWEYFFNGYLKWKTCPSCGHICNESLFNNYRTWLIGAAYKPCVNRTRNKYSNIRIGGSLGSDTHHFLGAVHLGYERNYVLPHKWIIYWQAKTTFVISGRDNFRTGIAIGLKMPL